MSSSLRVSLAACGGALLSLGLSGAAAQPASETVTVTGERLGSLNLDAPASTASHLGLTALQTPASLQIISGDTIRAEGDFNVIQAETRAAGFAGSASPGNGNSGVSVRGFNGVTSVMQLYDGAQLYVGSGTVTFPFDAWTVDRVEILSGPASVMFGAGAIGGVINVIPRKPDRMPGGEARLTAGSQDTFRAAVDLTGPLFDTAAYRIDISKNISSGSVDRGASDNLAVSAALSWDIAPNLSVTLSDDYGGQHPMRYFGTPLINGAQDKNLRERNFNVQDASMRFEDNWTRLETNWTPGAGIAVRNTAYFLATDRHWKDVENYSYVPASGLVQRSSYVEIYHHELQVGDHADASGTATIFGMENRVAAGFDLNVVRFQHTSDTPFGGTSTVNPLAIVPGTFINVVATIPHFRTYTQQYSVFAEDRLAITPTLSVIAGARNDNYNLGYTDLVTHLTGHNHYHTTSWRIGTVYDVKPNLAFYAQYATAADPVSSLITLSPAQQGFDLTTGRQVEIGAKQSFWGGRGEWTFAAYEIVKKKLLAPDPITPTIQQQIGAQSSRGMEFSGALDLGDGWRVQGNLAILGARFDDFFEVVSGVRTSRTGNRPPNVPDQTANLWTSWQFMPDWQALAGLRYVGQRFANNANTLRVPSYTVVDAGVTWNFAANFAADVKVSNLFDSVYAAAQSNAGNQWILGRPRAVEVSLRARF